MKRLILLCVATWCVLSVQAQVAPIWENYLSDRAAGITPELYDYSYAGYHFSEKEIPDVSAWTQFDVTDYGADGTDEDYDDESIQAAIDAAQLHDGPAVVYFPSGRFIVSPDNDVNQFLRITRDSIVLKGSGSGDGGTEIFMDQMRVKNGHWQFRFEPSDIQATFLTVLDAPASRGDRSVVVADASSLEPGMAIYLSHKSEAFARAHFDPLELSDDWTRLFGVTGGMTLQEPHLIASISGNRVTFQNPLQIDLPTLEEDYQVRSLPVIKEVGIEGILFVSDWENYEEEFVHHKDDIHDYAWNAIQFNNTQNGWLRNCEFRSWNQVVDVRQSIGVTIENVTISGKKGHASFLTRRGYGLLVKDCVDEASQHHGPGTGYSGVNTVYLRCQMQTDQSFDSHSGQPYATLVDNVTGGVFNKNGGPHESYPHHARGLTFWNFKHNASGNIGYDFWSLSRNGNTYADPYFVGFQPNTDVNLTDTGLNQLEGQQVEPASLFDAQLQLRLEEQATLPQVYFVSLGYGDHLDIGSDQVVTVTAEDPDGSIAAVRLFVNGVALRTIDTAPYVWGEDEALDPALFDLDAGALELKVEAEDDDGNIVTETIDVSVGYVPEVQIVKPDSDEIIGLGAPVVVEASASDEDGTVESVTLYLDGEMVSSLTTAPYVWSEIDALDQLEGGKHVLKVEAVDSDGLTAVVEQMLVINALPEVSFVTPAADAVLPVGSSVQVEINATDTDGTIARVDLYLDGTFYREEINPPFIWGERIDLDPELFGMAAGVYELMAVATDDIGSTSSATISVAVEAEVLSAKSDLDAVLVYPNPVTDLLTLDTSTTIQQVKMMDATGRLQTLIISDATTSRHLAIDTKQMDRGVYFLQVKTATDQQVVKVIKQ
ncbi:DUF4955 domain-containing protein [Reichenbachiella sp. MSK19-1]|uniref:DUF4955 domain-containing protein n=1 Tax=Reichenbachiella sp. MSK19-1 TaxID=1897631 RepID=UPI000E6BDD99|nr:DUF4955 domain-containing protein [Reichenbachiella sp. MSK19-1]RJE73042.1 hypothetical protein BGP76_03620 [Reichenbachiella sp. MSK19-1]